MNKSTFKQRFAELNLWHFLEAGVLAALCEMGLCLVAGIVGYPISYTSVGVMFNLFLLFSMGYDIPKDAPVFLAVAVISCVLTISIIGWEFNSLLQ